MSGFAFFEIKGGFVEVADTRALALDGAAMARWRRRWPHFMPWELDTDDYSLWISIEALDALERVRVRLGRQMRVLCAYRSKAHNVRVKSTAGENSRHRKGDAFDIVVYNMEFAEQVETLCLEEGFTAIGRYPTRYFIHVDMRPPKPSGKPYRWGRRWAGMAT